MRVVYVAFLLASGFLIAQQPAIVEGVLTDPSGAAIPAVTIFLSGTTSQRSVQTGSDGAYAFNGLVAGEWVADKRGKIALTPYAPLPRAARREVEDEAARLEAWLR